MEQFVSFGSERIGFTLEHRNRKTLAISVCPDLSVEVIAPANASFSQICAKVKKRAPWIIKQRTRFEKFLPRPTEKRYESGESFYYLGKQYRLKVIKSSEEQVTLSRGRLTVKTKNPQKRSCVKRQVNKWYREKAEIRFSKRIEALLPKLKRYQPKEPALQLKSMKKRWGSCTVGAKIILNPLLIKAPSHCIDYVIMHELCHLVIHNHSRKFWGLLGKMMPDWRERKERLERVEV